MPFPCPAIRLALCRLAWSVGSAMAGDDPTTAFERDVRPLLEERCLECHGPEKQKGGLRLDQKVVVFTGGDSEQPAVVPGKSGESQLIKRLLTTDPDEAMPPKGKRFTPEQIAVVRRWIDAGAHWPDAAKSAEPVASAVKGPAVTERDRAFWAFQPPRRGAAGLVGGAWAWQPLDPFVQAGFQDRGMQPRPRRHRRFCSGD